MATLARWCFHHRRIVLPAWIIALIFASAIAHSAHSSYSNDFSFPATDSSRAEDIVKANFRAQSGDSDQIVVQAKSGALADAATKTAVLDMLANVRALPFVATVVSPYASGLISKDGTIGLATVQLKAQMQDVSTSDAKRLIHTAQAASSSTLDVQLGGGAVQKGEDQGGGSADVIGGLLLALIVLFFAFRRSILSAVLPLISAVGAIGVGVSSIGLLSHVVTMPNFATQLAELISLGVGIDYALFIVNRHRRELLAGHTPEEAVVRALNTSGRAVLVAGLTVCIALLGMFALGLSFLYGVAVASALVVALTMVASLTLLPAMLGFYGFKVLARRERRALGAAGTALETGNGAVSGFWVRWSTMVGSRSAVLGILALGVIVVIALPFFSIRLGIADSGEDPSSSTTRHAYQLLVKGFGPGFNGPLQVVGKVNGPGDADRYNAFVGRLSGEAGVAKVLPTRTSPNGKALVTFVYPLYSPQAPQTTALVNHIRSEVPAATSGSSLAVHVGGETAGGIDFSKVLSGKMPLFVTVVVVLAFLLLAAVFRSLLVPLTASIMNLLSIGAALGAMVAAFQWGWAKPVLRFASAGPIEVYLPVMVFAVLFGLSMDYEVFLVSRMHEEWVLSGDNDRAVSRGQSETGRVITAAALIMIFVFLSFSLLGNALVIEEFGIGFAAAIVIDAFVVRTVLVPALMHVFGKANWWLPGWLDRLLPTLHIEAEDLVHIAPEPEEAAAGAR